MKFGITVLSNIYSLTRAEIAQRSFTSLAKTNMEGLERPTMVLSVTTTAFDYNPYMEMFQEKCNVVVTRDVDAGSISNLFVIASDYLLQDESITNLIYLPDDFVYNQLWLIELSKLITRHPNATAWAVYRSSYTRHHRIVGGDDKDCLMSCNDAVGCVSREEWIEYRKLLKGDFSVPEQFGGGCTIDVHHAYARPGERWATTLDYIQNICVHPHLGRQDMAIDFIGE